MQSECDASRQNRTYGLIIVYFWEYIKEKVKGIFRRSVKLHTSPMYFSKVYLLELFMLSHRYLQSQRCVRQNGTTFVTRWEDIRVLSHYNDFARVTTYTFNTFCHVRFEWDQTSCSRVFNEPRVIFGMIYSQVYKLYMCVCV